MAKFTLHIRLADPAKKDFDKVSGAISKISVHSPNCHFKTKTMEGDEAQFTIEGAINLVDLNRAVVKALDQLPGDHPFYILKAKSSSNW